MAASHPVLPRGCPFCTPSARLCLVYHAALSAGASSRSDSHSSHRLIRVASIWRRSQGNPFRILDKISDLRQEFSFSARRIAMAAFAELVAVHWLACTLWWTLRLQGYPQSRHTGSLSFLYFVFLVYVS